MKESAIVRKIVKAVEREFPSAWVRKLSDRYTRGLPDLLIVYPMGNVLFVEVKRPGGKESKIQEHERNNVLSLGCNWIVVTDPEDVLEWIRETLS